MGNKRAGEAKQQFVIINVGDRQAIDIANQHNLVVANIIRPRNSYNLIAAYFVGVGDLCQAQIVNKMFGMIVYTLRSENLP